jgi:hypothetical protein
VPAGHVVLVALVAVVVGSFLNAQGLRKMAYTQPDGWRRDIGMAFTAPLVDIAGLLRLDQPREGLKEVLGRGEDDRIATTVVLPPPSTDVASPEGVAAPADTTTDDATGTGTGASEGGTSTAAGEAEAPSKPLALYTPKRPMRLWIAGDSLSIVPGEALLRLTAGNDAVESVGADRGVEGRLATGLERPDRYDWFTRIQEEMKGKDSPDVVVLTFGSNDIGGYMEGLPEGEEKAPFGSPDWLDQYRERVAGVMDIVMGNGKRNPPRVLVWIGVPIVQDDEKNESYKTVNAIVRSEAEKRAPYVAYVDTYRMFRDEDGGFAQRLPDADGHLQEVRSPDGLHFEPAGGDIVAEAVMKRIEAVVRIRDDAPATDDQSTTDDPSTAGDRATAEDQPTATP